MSLKTLNFRFWLITFAAIVSAVITLKLGFWQLGRAHEKLALQASIQSQSTLPALNAAALVSPQISPQSTNVLHRTIALTGHWLPQYTLFLDNRQMDNKPGFFVLTPFEFTKPATSTSTSTSTAVSSKHTILVQRGWLPRNFLDRNKLPVIASEAAELTITGRIALSPSKLFEFKGTETGAIRQNIEIDALSKEFKIDLLPYSLLQLDIDAADTSKAEQPDQLFRQWAQPNYGSEKNYGYMVQWWALSALITVLYVWFQLLRPHLKSKNIITDSNDTNDIKNE